MYYQGIREPGQKKVYFKPILFFIGLSFLEAFIQVISSLIIRVAVKGEFPMANTVIWTISKFICLIIAIILLRGKFKESSNQVKANPIRFIVYIAIAFIIFYLFELGTSYYERLIQKIFGEGEALNQEGIYEYFRADSRSINYILLIITICILAPLLEELEYRVLIFDAFKGCKWWVPALISTLLFGGAHMQFTALLDSGMTAIIKELSYFPVYALPGFALSLCYHYSGNNLYTNVFCHALINTLSVISIIIMITGEIGTAV